MRHHTQPAGLMPSKYHLRRGGCQNDDPDLKLHAEIFVSLAP